MQRFTMSILATDSRLSCVAVSYGVVLALLIAVFPGPLFAGDSWPQWRGPNQNGLAGEGEFPVRWDEENNVKWKTRIDGNGGSTPVVSRSTAYVTTGSGGKNLLVAVSIDDGEIAWTQTIGKDRGLRHRKGGGANPSSVVRGDLIYAYFRSGDLACVNSQGKVVWELNLQQKYGKDKLKWDLGTSLLMTDDALVIAVVQSGSSYVLAIDPASGDELWKVDRNFDAPQEANDSYSTPLSVRVAGREAIAVLGADHLTLNDAANGSLIGTVGGFNPNQRPNFRCIASPVASGDIAVCPYSRGDTVTAIDMKALASGEGKKSIIWFRDDVGSDVPTPAIVGEQVIFVGGSDKLRGTVTSLDMKTGKTRWSLQVPLTRHDFTSSPLVAGNHVYVTSENGATHVIGPLDAESPTLISSNPLDDDKPFTKSSPIAVENSLLIRTKSFLYRIGR